MKPGTKPTTSDRALAGSVPGDPGDPGVLGDPDVLPIVSVVKCGLLKLLLIDLECLYP